MTDPMWHPINAETDKPLTWSHKDWPMAIHGLPKQGSSFYTVVMAADFIRHGDRVVYLCAKAEGVRALQNELAEPRPATKYQSVTSAAATDLADMQLVTMVQKNGLDILESLRALTDWGERIVVLKNCDQLLTPSLWAVIKSHRRLVLSGDFTRLPVTVEPSLFATTVSFSAPPSNWHHQRVQLPSYVGDGYRGNRHFQTIVRETRHTVPPSRSQG